MTMDTSLIDALRDSSRDVLSDFCSSVRRHRLIDSEGDFDRELWQTMGELGWLSMGIPEDCGGAGGSFAAVACLQQELGGALAAVPFLGTSLLTRALLTWPDPARRSGLLPELAAGRIVGGSGDLSPGRSDVIASEDSSGGYELTGSCPALDGISADLLLVPVTSKAGESGLALIEVGAPGVTVSRMPLADMTRTMALVSCAKVSVDRADAIFGEPARSLVDRLNDDAKLLIASDSVGGAQAALETTVEYLKVREQFGKPIGSFQALKHRCADHKVVLEAARYLTGHALESETTSRRGELVALAKFQACDGYAAIAADGVQMHGGIGFTWEHDAHLFLKRAMLNQFLFGTSAEQQDRAAALMLGQREAA
jgi:alkylation response protein AidB-like acyl-CoA dehydrogenase